MLGNALPSLLQHVRRLAVSASSDEQLLADFLARRSDEAFAALLGRHGPMVLNVCRRILHDAHAAEDVFQATFLVLADRAGALRRPASLAAFLHGVAYRLAVRARRRKLHDLPAAVRDRAAAPPEELAWTEVLGILDQELSRLSDRYRAPLVLCYLEGRTQDEAARQLGWGLNTLRRRLAEGRRLLEARLRGRGVSLPAALAGLLAASAAAVPGPLRAATLAAVAARSVGPAPVGASALLLPAAGKKVGAVVVMAVLASAVCFAYYPSPHEEPAPAASDPATPAAAAGAGRDDPLPARGTIRLGTARYRHGSRIESFVVSADGRLAATSGGWDSFSPARVFDLTDGHYLYSVLPEHGKNIEAVGLSPDGKILAAKDNTFIYFRDAATGRELRKLKYLPDSGGDGRSVTSWLTFTPDGKQLAATLMRSAIQLIDVETAQVKRTFDRGAAARVCVFSADGQLMAAGGYEQEKNVYSVRLWKVATGREVRRFAIAHENNRPVVALALSPDGTKLAAASWRGGRLRLFEVATGAELKVSPKVGDEIHCVTFAPDSKTVAVADDRIRLHDIATGEERLRIERQARALAFSRDGSVLIGAVSGAIYRWDAASGRQLTPTEAQDSAVEQILVSADGRSVFTTNQDGDLYIWDTSGGKSPRRIAAGVERGFVASRDGRLLAWAARDAHGGSQVRLYDVASRRVIDRFPIFPDIASVVAFSPDGKTLLTFGGLSETVRIWDVVSGKERRSFGVVVPKPKGNLGLGQRTSPLYTVRRVAISPDGKTLAIGPDWPTEQFLTPDRSVFVCLRDAATGEAGHELQEPLPSAGVPDEAGDGRVEMSRGALNRRFKSTDGRAFSPDGRFLADWELNPFGRSRMDHVHVWDMATGQAVATLTAGSRPGAANAAFAPDGRSLAAASADGTIRLWETATWKVRAEYRGHRDQVTALAFGPDGRLFSGGLDTVVLGWNVRPPRGPVKGPLSDAWDALAHADAKTAFSAQGRFLTEPAESVEWLAARLAPVRRPDPARVKALIADLDHEGFAQREKAMADLKECWPFSAAALREVAAKSSSAEARHRAEQIVREMENAIPQAAELRKLRAIEILEWIGTPEAGAVLKKLTKGAPEARLTREAAAVCKRLDERK